MDIGRRIVSSRERKGWNQRELAKRVNLNPSVMNRIELGERPVKDHELLRLSEVLDVTADYLIGKSSHVKLSAEKDKEVDKEVEELLEIIKSMPADQRKEMEGRILAYAKGLADANKRD